MFQTYLFVHVLMYVLIYFVSFLAVPLVLYSTDLSMPQYIHVFVFSCAHVYIFESVAINCFRLYCSTVDLYINRLSTLIDNPSIHPSIFE